METKSAYICVTDWEKVEADDFYLTNEWIVKTLGQSKSDAVTLRKRACDGELYFAYIVSAVDFCVYGQMDAQQIIVDRDQNELVTCESEVIDNEKEDKWEHEGY